MGGRGYARWNLPPIPFKGEIPKMALGYFHLYLSVGKIKKPLLFL
jgi:hypothetical protein